MSPLVTAAFVFLPFALLSLSVLCLQLPAWLRWPVVVLGSAEGMYVALVALRLQ
jgi:hypothetical protein